MECASCHERLPQDELVMVGQCVYCEECAQYARMIEYLKSLADDPTMGSECAMCGQDYDVRVYPDGKPYCARCWQVWNSQSSLVDTSDIPPGFPVGLKRIE